jgi:hypothetical protein
VPFGSDPFDPAFDQKADFVPIDFRILNAVNQGILMNYIKTLTPEQQAKFIIVR